jgi:hypothetical protein
MQMGRRGFKTEKTMSKKSLKDKRKLLKETLKQAESLKAFAARLEEEISEIETGEE